MKLHIAICDDEVNLCKETKEKILGIRPEYAVDLFLSGEELLENRIEYDMIFLDVEMPGQSGMEIAENLRKQKYMGHIIFLTSHAEYMPEAFKVRAFRYLTKPVNMDALGEVLAESECEFFEDKKLVVDLYGTEILINLRDIVYIEAMKKNTVLYLTDRCIDAPYSLKYWMEKLSGDDFCQVHKSFVVSLNYIVQVECDAVVLRGVDSRVPLSRRRHDIVKRAFFNYVKQNARMI